MKRQIATIFGCLASTIILALTLAPSAGAAPAAPTVRASNCKNIGNGNLCIDVSPVGTKGRVKVWYTKIKGPAVKADLVWRSGGPVFGSTPVWMFAGKTYSQEWPTFIGRGTTHGGIRVVGKPIIWGPSVRQ